jgi:hypothetical protein
MNKVVGNPHKDTIPFVEIMDEELLSLTTLVTLGLALLIGFNDDGAALTVSEAAYDDVCLGYEVTNTYFESRNSAPCPRLASECKRLALGIAGRNRNHSADSRSNLLAVRAKR